MDIQLFDTILRLLYTVDTDALLLRLKLETPMEISLSLIQIHLNGTSQSEVESLPSEDTTRQLSLVDI